MSPRLSNRHEFRHGGTWTPAARSVVVTGTGIIADGTIGDAGDYQNYGNGGYYGGTGIRGSSLCGPGVRGSRCIRVTAAATDATARSA